ncbi:MAG TPA: M10 family metallopeptidase C-terminal domain-containing protein [Allosphingosinicella sp.]|nr:M10 family metallopeptidase C-terminal domain-containing protein [Allosphingosinicella sp.]
MASPYVRVNDDGFIVTNFSKIYDVSGYLAELVEDYDGSVSASPSPIAHHPNGGSTGGTLSDEDGGDLIAVTLVAGQTYTFSYRGTATEGVIDPYLRLLAGDQTTVIAEDDDGGLGRGSQITFTATTDGTYYLNATSWYQIDPTAPDYQDDGDYTIVQWSPAPGHDAGNTIGGARAIGLGTNYEYLEMAGDRDYYAVELTAGNVYSFTYNGGIASEAVNPGESIGVLGLYNATGGAVVGLSVNTGGETTITYFAQQTGTYYLRAEAYSNFTGGTAQTGGYTLDIVGRTLAEIDPLDAIDWKSSDVIDTTLVSGVPTAKVYFAVAGENFGERNGANPLDSLGWNDVEKAAVMDALLEYTKVLGIHYEITTDANEAEFRLITTGPGKSYGAYMYPQDPAYGTQQGVSAYNIGSGGWNLGRGSGDQPALVKGGFAYGVILHEMGHGHGLAHAHDRGGGSEVMVGVTAATNSYGVYNLNQGVYTVMSYNDGWDFHPDGGSPFNIPGISQGWSGTLGAFDIAALQRKYDVRPDFATGDDVYTLSDANARGTYYETIYDTGGNDTIAYSGERDATIDLTAATLDYTPTGGGVLSFARGIWGGYTIANGVLIENATSGAGDDMLIGNEVANVLTSNDGNDVLLGRGGNDILLAGAGDDLLFGGDGLDVATLGEGDDIFVAERGTAMPTRMGLLSYDIITDFDASGDDKIDLSDFGPFTFKDTDSNKLAGDLTYKSYGNIASAEKALGIEIDGITGVGNIGGPVTVVLANLDGGAPDLAFVLMNTKSVSADDFMMAPSASAFAADSAGFVPSNNFGSSPSQSMLLFHEMIIA